MSDINISVTGTKRLKTAGKYCADDIVVTALGGETDIKIQGNKTVTPTKSQQTVTPDSGYNALSSVTVNKIPDEYIQPTETMDIDENGTYDVTACKTVNVDVPTGGGSEDLNAVLAEQESLIAELKAALEGKASGGGGIVSDGVLPDGYRYVQAIKFTGEQAVDTGVICNQNTIIRAIYTRDGSASMYLYGVVDSAQTKAVTAYLYENGGSGKWRFGNQSVAYECKANAEIIRTAVVTKSRIVREATTQSLSGVSDFTAERPLYLGACCAADGSIDPLLFVGKIIAFEIRRDNASAPVLKFIPCINESGVCGFFDTVSQSFFASITDTQLESAYI